MSTHTFLLYFLIHFLTHLLFGLLKSNFLALLRIANLPQFLEISATSACSWIQSYRAVQPCATLTRITWVVELPLGQRLCGYAWGQFLALLLSSYNNVKDANVFYQRRQIKTTLFINLVGQKFNILHIMTHYKMTVDVLRH